MNHRRLLPMALMLIGLVPAAVAQGQAERHGGLEHDRRHDIELFIDATPLIIESTRHHRADSERPSDDGSSICRQADRTTWSTRTQPCPDPEPVERLEIWTTSSP